MNKALEITFRNIPPSDTIATQVAERFEGLQKFCADITGCRVTIESPHQHKNKGRAFHIRIELTVPRHEILVAHDPGSQAEREDLPLALRNAFRAARRQLKDYMAVRHGKMKRNDASIRVATRATPT